MKAHLELLSDDAGQSVHELDPTESVSLGRNHGNRIVLRDEHASRFHAQLFCEGAQWYIRDLDTRNGTTVEGMRVVGTMALGHGQEIVIGTTRLLFTVESPAVPSVLDGQPQPPPALSAYDSSGGHTTPLQPDDLSALYHFVAGSMAEADPRALVRQALHVAQGYTTASVAGFLSLDPEDPLPKIVLPETAQVDIHLSRRLTQRAQQTGGAVWLQRDAHEKGSESDSLLAFADALCIPLRTAAGPLGALHLYKDQDPFNERAVRFCEILGGNLAMSLSLLRARRRLEAENLRLRARSPVSDQTIGDSRPIREVRRLIARVAPRHATVLITGESGVGKDLVAGALHCRSLRRDGPFVPVSCPSIAPSLLEAELFGHEKGAFTGADRARPGLFRQADEGTLFLDEVGELSLDCQAKLLRVIEGKGFRPVGATSEVKTDVRIIAATNRDLEEEVAAGRFREDLYFRLRVIQIHVPPLRSRRSDIPALVSHFLQRLSADLRQSVRVSDAAMERLVEFDWPATFASCSGCWSRRWR